MDITDQLSLRIVTRIGCEQSLLVGQQQQLVGTAEHRRQRREIVVVTHFDFSGGDGIVLIDHRHNVVIQQRAQRVAGIQEALAIFHVGTGQQHLTNMDTVD